LFLIELILTPIMRFYWKSCND